MTPEADKLIDEWLEEVRSGKRHWEDTADLKRRFAEARGSGINVNLARSELINLEYTVGMQKGRNISEGTAAILERCVHRLRKALFPSHTESEE